MKEKLCRICGHRKNEHHSHIAPDHTGQKIKHVSCRVVISRTPIDMKEIGITSIGNTCSCHGYKPNTYLSRAIKKYRKFLKELPKTSDNIYRRKEIEKQIRRFRNSIKENPKNQLHWQIQERNIEN